MTYASGVGDEIQGARTVIWVAEDFREEHQKSLSWLNEVAQSAVRFYGVQLELYRIGGSAPAPSLNVLVRPNEVERARRDAPTNNVSGERNLFYVEYWTEFKKFCIAKNAHFSLQSPRPSYYIQAALGRSYDHLAFTAGRRDKYIGCEISLRGTDPERTLRALMDDKVAIENEIGNQLIWNSISAKFAKIELQKLDEPSADRDRWSAQHQWLFEQGERFYASFSPRLRRLK
jgi:hypothetical protein